MPTSIDTYMLSEPRNAYSQAANNGVDAPGHPRSDDAGNFTGCQLWVGYLRGTFRDVSACMLSDKRGYPVSAAELKALTFQDVKDLFRPIWNQIGAGDLSDQDVANIYMHIRLHFGNVWVVQAALNRLGENLSIDGAAGPLTREAIKRQTSRNRIKTYNTIREELRRAYENTSQPAYVQPFLTQLNKYFPVKKTNVNTFQLVTGVISLASLGYLAYTEYKNYRNG